VIPARAANFHFLFPSNLTLVLLAKERIGE
jgi:hypothetical protein